MAFVSKTGGNTTAHALVAFSCSCQLCEKALTDVYMIRRMNLDSGGDAEVSPKSVAEQEEKENEVAVAFCLECFDRTE